MVKKTLRLLSRHLLENRCFTIGRFIWDLPKYVLKAPQVLSSVLLHSTWIRSSSHQRGSVRKGVLRNFAKFTGKHQCQSLFFNKVAGLSLVTSRENIKYVAKLSFNDECPFSKELFIVEMGKTKTKIKSRVKLCYMDTEHNCVWDGDRRFLQSRRKRSRYQVWSSGYWRVRLQAWWNKGMVENS